MLEIKYEVVKISVHQNQLKARKKELNLIGWNGEKPKYDIREWVLNQVRMGKERSEEGLINF